jgi:parvulin-like peptidyl-prolyl isomerase
MKTKLIALFGAAAIALVACGEADITGTAAASVGGRKITVEEVDKELAKFEDTGQFETLTAEEEADKVRRQFQQGYLSQIVRRYVLRPVAAERGIEVGQDEVDEALEGIKADFPSEEEFESALDQQGVSLDQLPELIRDQLTEEQLRADVAAELEPTEDELQSHYDENLDTYRQTEASHIVVEKEAEAARLARQLQNENPDQVAKEFARQARELSTDEGSKKKGGELGYFAPGEFIPEFDEAAAELEIGEISDPVQSQFGWHVIRVTDRRLQPFEDVSEQIAQELSGAKAEEAYQDLVVRAYEDADIRVNSRFGELDIESQRIADATAEDVPGAEEPEGEPSPAEGEQAPATPPEDQ